MHSLSDGDPKQQLTDLAAPATFGITPDDKWVLYHGRDSAGKHSLFRIATSGGTPERIGDFPSRKQLGVLLVSPDGRKVLAISQNQNEFWELENFEPKALQGAK